MILTRLLRTTLRKLKSTPGYTLVNVIGLTTGLTMSILISVFVYHSLSYDDFHEAADRLYRVTLTESFQSQQVPVYPPEPLGPALERTQVDIESTTRIRFSDAPVYVSAERRTSIREAQMSYADPSLFDMFGFSLQHGDMETALQQPFSIVLSPEMARKYFGEQNPIDKSLTIDGNNTYTVTGVLAPLPGPSHLSFDLLASYATLPQLGIDTEAWETGESSLYLRAADMCEGECIEETVKQHLGEKIDARRVSVVAESVPSLHLYGLDTDRQPREGDVRYVWLLATIAFLILVMACVNYTNLATSRSLERQTEIGVKKALGATRSQLIRQHLAEPVVLCLSAFVLSLGLSAGLLSPFESFVGARFEGSTVLGVFAAFSVVAALTGLAAGGYPALYLSRLRPAHVLEQEGTTGGRGHLRTVLVVFQFAVSIVFLAAAFVVHGQLNHMETRDLGLQPQNLMVLDGSNVGDRYGALKEGLLQLPGVRSVSHAPVPGHKNIPIMSVIPEGQTDDVVWIPTLGVDQDFVSTAKISVLSGRDFRSTDDVSAGGTVLINETAKTSFGWDDAVGRRLSIPSRGKMVENEVIGVVKDFHYASLEQSVEPLVMRTESAPGRFGNVIVRIHPDDVGETVRQVGTIWADIVPSSPFIYHFMDRQFDSYQREEQSTGKVVGLAAGFTSLIAYLGLLCLATYTVRRRLKEIGIRKALGASMGNIAGLLMKNVLLLIVISSVVALPIAYILTDAWLSQFAYRMSTGVADFFGIVVLSSVLAILAVSYQLLQAVNVDPVDHLRHP